MNLLLFSLVLINGACGQNYPRVDDIIAWGQFKMRFNKEYSPKEDKARFERFVEVKKLIDDHNEKFRQGVANFEVEINELADRYPGELNYRTDGILRPKGVPGK